MKKAVIYGAGENYNLFMKFAVERDFEIVAVADRRHEGECLEGQRVVSPDEIKETEYDEIFITNSRPVEIKEIKKFLLEKVGVPIDKIRDVQYLNERYMFCNMQNYKYVVFTDDWDYLNALFKDLEHREDVAIRSDLWESRIEGINKVYEDEIYFIFRSQCYYRHYNTRFFDYIRRRFPNSKMIFHLSDLCEGKFACLGAMKDIFSIEYLKKTFDMVITFHSKEAKKYRFQRQTSPYSVFPMQPHRIDTDVFYVGNAKDRLEEIHRIFLHLTSNGVRCRFIVNNVEEYQYLKGYEGIEYNKRVKYQEYLEMMMGSKCILDVCQENDETTSRLAEAVAYNKLLLVNEPSCTDNKYYCQEWMQHFTDPESIDTDWIKEDKTVDFHYENDFSPNALLKMIDCYFAREAAGVKPLSELHQTLKFSKYGDVRGNLVVMEGEYRDIPFNIKRVFFIYVNDVTEIRGKHANRESELVLVCASGNCKVRVTNGYEEEILELNDPQMGLYIAPMCWKEMYEFSDDAVLLVLSSEHYSQDEYISDFEEYQKMMGVK